MQSEKIDELIEVLSRNVKFQSGEEIKKKVQKASNRKILRRQLELLAECSRTDYQYLCPIPEASQAIANIHRELSKAERILLVRILIVLLGLLYLLKCFMVKNIQFIKR